MSTELGAWQASQADYTKHPCDHRARWESSRKLSAESLEGQEEPSGTPEPGTEKLRGLLFQLPYLALLSVDTLVLEQDRAREGAL